MENTVEGFELFWKTWPRNSERYSRKGAKSQCLKVWIKGHHESQTETIVAHVRWLATTHAWLQEGGAYIPAPLVYLNQQRWDGAEIPATPVACEQEREAIYQAQLRASIEAMRR
jgi:hypothetical protein